MGALAVVAVVSGGAAYAATQDDSPQARSQAIVNDAAGTLGVDPAKLSDALKKALSNQVDAQVAAGKLTKERGDAIKARIEDGTLPIFGGGRGGPGKHFGHRGRGFGFGPGFGHRFGGPGLAAGIEEIATYLGLEPAELRTQLHSGKSLADIVKAQGKTVDGLKAAITDAVTKRLDAAVTAGKLTKEQETKLLAALADHLDALVNGVRPPRAGSAAASARAARATTRRATARTWTRHPMTPHRRRLRRTSTRQHPPRSDRPLLTYRRGFPPPYAHPGSAPARFRGVRAVKVRGAVAAEADDGEVAEARAEPGRLLHGVAHAVEALRRHGVLRAAALADEVLALPPGAYVAPGAVPEVDVLHEAQPLERLEVAVDRGQVRDRQLADTLGDLLGAERGIGRIQRLEHHAPGSREPQAAGAQRGHCLGQRLRLDARAGMGGGHPVPRVEDRSGL